MKDDCSRRSFIKKLVRGGVAGGAAGITIREDMSLREFFGDASAQFFFQPCEYTNPGATKNVDDIEKFADEFKHSRDKLNGIYNTVTPVTETVKNKRGNCVDYSAFAASWVKRNYGKMPTIVVYAPKKARLGHMNVYADGTIYDYYKNYYNTSPEKYAESQKNLFLLAKNPN
jgi:hypothetical protein